MCTSGGVGSGETKSEDSPNKLDKQVGALVIREVGDSSNRRVDDDFSSQGGADEGGSALKKRKILGKSKRDAEGVVSKTRKPSIIDSGESKFLCQSRPRALIDVIKSLNEKQKDDIRSVGFGGLLHLQVNRLTNHKMLEWLVNHFNHSSRMLELDSVRGLVITADDVHDVFMLPRNPGVAVVKYLRNEESPLLTRFKTDYNIRPNASFQCLEAALKEKFPDGGDDFKRIFVLFSILSFLAPSNRVVSTMYLKSLEDVDQISKFDWCSLVLDKLCDAIKVYKSRGINSLTGCVLLLQVIYFHRMKWQGFAEPCTLPLIQHWTDKKVQDRCKQENEAGKFGSGELLLNTYPISVNGIVAGKVAEKSNAGNERSQTKFTVEERDKEMNAFLSSLKKDAIEFHDKYIGRLIEISQENHANRGNQESSSSSPGDDSFCVLIDRLVENFRITKMLAIQGPNFKILSPDPVNTAPPYTWDRSYVVAEEPIGEDCIGIVGSDMVEEGGATFGAVGGANGAVEDHIHGEYFGAGDDEHVNEESSKCWP